MVVASCIGCAASQPRAYTLRVNASDPADVSLCRLEQSKSNSKPARSCEVFDHQSLEAPARLNVELTNVKDGATYELEVDHRYMPGHGQQGRRVLGEVIKRLLGYAGDFVNAVEVPSAQGGDRKGETAAAQTSLLNELAVLGSEWATAVATNAAGAEKPVRPAAARQTPDLLFNRWVDANTKTFTDGAAGTDKLFGEPAFQPPPPRVAQLDARDVAHLQKSGIEGEKLAQFIKKKCEPSSFGQYAPLNVDWANVPQRVEIKPAMVAQALMLDENAIAGALLAREAKLNVSRTVSTLLTRAHAALAESKRPDPDAELIYLASRLALLNKHADNCKRNLQLAASLHPAGDYRATQEAAAKLVDSTKSTATLFEEAVQPFLVRAARNHFSSTASGDRVAFGAVSVRAGSVTVVAQQRVGETRSKIAELTLDARSGDPIALIIGPFGSACDGCFSRVEESVSPGDGTTPAGRVLRETKESQQLGAAVAAHVSIWSIARHHVGIFAGYPVAGGAESPAEVLLGAGYRHAIGVSAALGAHLFERTELRSGLGSEVDLGAPGNVALNPEDVSDDELGVAFFALIGVSSDLFTSE